MPSCLRAFFLLLTLLAPPAFATDGPGDDEPILRHDGPRGPARAEDVPAMLEVLREMEPQLGKDVDQWRAENPQRAAELMQRRFPRLRYLAYLRQHDRELYDLRLREFRGGRALIEAVRTYRTAQLAKDPKAPDLLQALRTQFAEQFELRQTLRRAELDRLEKRLAAMRKELADRAARRDAVIEDQLRHALRDAPNPKPKENKPNPSPQP